MQKESMIWRREKQRTENEKQTYLSRIFYADFLHSSDFTSLQPYLYAMRMRRRIRENVFYDSFG